MLNEVHSLSPKRIDYITKQPLVASSVQLIQTAVKLPISMTYGDTRGNRTQQSASSMWSCKIYKRETNLKYSEGSVEVYKSLDDYRAGVELYTSLEGNAALKVV